MTLHLQGQMKGVGNNSRLSLVLDSVESGSVWGRISVILSSWESAQEKSYSRDTADEGRVKID